ncbi:MAG TPA: response regulator [Thermoanaerobaculia bacterium]|nr:response regulator [Thermoanaerobaculia bacterium]
MAIIRAALVDDADDDLKIAGRLLRTGIQCDPIRPPDEENSFEQLINQLRAGNYDIVLLDYRLDDEVPRGYRGGTVAARLKEFHPDMPVVLLTTEEKLEASVRHNPRVAALFDHLVLKEDLAHADTRKRRAAEMHDLVASYQILKEEEAQPNDDLYDIVSRLARATEDDRFAPSVRNRAARTPELANWFLQEFLAYPGSVLPISDVAARLGIAQTAAEGDAVRSWLAPASYAGVFATIRERWWRGRLDLRLIGKRSDLRDKPATARAAFISKAIGVRIPPARCAWCGGEYVERACAICKEAVDASHFLVGNIDDRPGWAEPARVCFRCIAQGDAEDVRFITGAEQIAHKLRTGELKRPA